MARLVLLNGAPGSGKSTMARMYVEEHPLSLALDIDVVRGMLGGWLHDPVASGSIARNLALAMARVRLVAGGEVIVPQYLGRLDFILRLEALALELSIPFVEVALLSDAQEATSRFLVRSESPATSAHRDAAALLERTGGVDELPAMYSRLLDVIAARARTNVVLTIPGDIESTYQLFLDQLNRPPR